MDTKKKRHKTFVILLAILVIAGIGVVFFGLPWGLQAFIVVQLEKVSGQTIHVDDVAIHYVDQAIIVKGFQMVDSHTSQPMVTIDQLQVNFRWLPIFSKQIDLPHVFLRHPVLSVFRAPDGTINFNDLRKDDQQSSEPSQFTVLVHDLELTEGALTYQDFSRPGNPGVRLDDIHLQISGFSTGTHGPVPIRLQASLAENGRMMATGAVHLTPFSLESQWEMKEVLLSPYQQFLTGLPLFSGILNSAFSLDVSSDQSAPIRVRGDIRVQDIRLGPQSSPFLTGSSMEGSDVEYVWPDHLNINHILFHKLSLDILREHDGRLPILASFKGAGDSQPKSDQDQKTFVATINQILIKDSQIQFIDKSIQPEYRKQFTQLMVEMNSITSKPDDMGHIVAKASTPEEETMELDGKLRLLGKDLYLNVDGVVKDFAIPGFNPYAEHMLGWGTQSGELTNKFHIKVEEQRLHSTSKIGISDLRVIRAGTEDLVDRRLGLPLGLMVDLIKNIHGNIHLKIEVDGELNKPEFSIRDAIWKSLRNAVVNIVAAPLRLIGNLIKSNKKIKDFDIHPVHFKAGTTTLAAGMQERVQNLKTFLQKTPFISLKVHPVMSQEDLKVLRIREVTSRIVEVESQNPSLKGVKAVQALYKEKFPDKEKISEKDPSGNSEQELALLKELVAAEPTPTLRVGTLASDRMEKFLDLVTAAKDISPRRLHKKEYKETSRPAKTGGLEFSILR